MAKNKDSASYGIIGFRDASARRWPKAWLPLAKT